MPWVSIEGHIAYRGSRPGGVGHGRVEEKNKDHMVRDMLTQKACLWDFRHADRRYANSARICAIRSLFAMDEVEREALDSSRVSN